MGPEYNFHNRFLIVVDALMNRRLHHQKCHPGRNKELLVRLVAVVVELEVEEEEDHFEE